MKRPIVREANADLDTTLVTLRKIKLGTVSNLVYW